MTRANTILNLSAWCWLLLASGVGLVRRSGTASGASHGMSGKSYATGKLGCISFMRIPGGLRHAQLPQPKGVFERI